MKIKLDINEVLRYSGVRCQVNELDKELEKIYLDKIKFTEENLKFKVCYQLFSIDKNSFTSEIKIRNTSLLLNGNDIYNFLKDCNKCLILAGSLGVLADKILSKLSYSNITENLIFDACCTELIEKSCDELYDEFEKKYGAITTRFSPGYGDLTLDLQPQIITVLNADKWIGLTANRDNNLLIPTKSITAIIGIKNNFLGFSEKASDFSLNSKCLNCKNPCQFRKVGFDCE